MINFDGNSSPLVTDRFIIWATVVAHILRHAVSSFPLYPEPSRVPSSYAQCLSVKEQLPVFPNLSTAWDVSLVFFHIMFRKW